MNGQLDERTLCQLLDIQSDRFGQAITSLDAIEAALRREGWSLPVHESLQVLMRDLSSDSGCKDAFQQWSQCQSKSSQQVKAAVERTRTTLKRLLKRVDSVESVARELKDRLVPRIDQGIRARDAVNAYRLASVHTNPDNAEYS